MVLHTQQSLKTSKVDHADDVEIEHLANGGVIVRKDYPDDQRRKGMKVVAIVSSILCLVPVILWFMYRNGSVGWFAVLVAVFFAITLVYGMIRQFAAKTRSYILRADHTGLTIEMTTWWRRTTRHFTLGQIDDIVLDCSGGNDPQNSLFKSWLVIKSPVSRNIRCLHDVGGDQLARVANALRAALRMPARSWP